MRSRRAGGILPVGAFWRGKIQTVGYRRRRFARRVGDPKYVPSSTRVALTIEMRVTPRAGDIVGGVRRAPVL
jgi:hypothetical protein